MNSIQQYRGLHMDYSLHPLISELNIDLLNQNPYNPLQFIKFWATKKLKEIYSLEQNSSEQEEIHKQVKTFIDNRLVGISPDKQNYTKNKQVKQIKRRKAVFFYPEPHLNTRKQIQKSQEAKSRINISLRNDIFFQRLSWDQVGYFVEKGHLFETQFQNTVLQLIDQPIKQFFVLVSGQVIRQNRQGQQTKIYYSGESLCQQSFLHPMSSQFQYVCRQPNTLLFSLPGHMINSTIQSIYDEKFTFYQRALMNKQEFNYLDNEQKDKMISCFKEIKQIMAGEIVFNGVSEGNMAKQRRFYIILKGKFSKCKRSLTGEFMAFKTLKVGDFFGEESLFLDFEADYIVLCLDDNSEIAYVDKQDLQNSVDSYERIVKRAKMQVRLIQN